MDGGREERVVLKQSDKWGCGKEGPPWLVICEAGPQW